MLQTTKYYQAYIYINHMYESFNTEMALRYHPVFKDQMEW